jgi:hypothetical protein
MTLAENSDFDEDFNIERALATRAGRAELPEGNSGEEPTTCTDASSV